MKLKKKDEEIDMLIKIIVANGLKIAVALGSSLDQNQQGFEGSTLIILMKKR